jgi:hypothetical protein
MEYGILIAESDCALRTIGEYQIIGAVDSPSEARELAQNYLANGPDSACLAPDRFVIHRRGHGGWYTVRETVEL